MNDKFGNLSNSEVQSLINEWIKNERDRYIMKRRYIDGITVEKLAEEKQVNMSVRNLAYILSKNTKLLLSKINPEK